MVLALEGEWFALGGHPFEFFVLLSTIVQYAADQALRTPLAWSDRWRRLNIVNWQNANS